MRKVVYLLVKLALLFGLVLILFSYAMFQGGFVSWFLFYTSLPFLIYYLFFIFYPIRDWHVKRVVTTSPIQAGQSIQVRIELTRHLPFPVSYLIIEDFLPESARSYFTTDRWGEMLEKGNVLQREASVKQMLYPLFRRKLEYSYDLNHLPRGKHAFEQLSLTMTDIFGFITKSIVLPTPSIFRVTPANLDLYIRWNDQENRFGEGLTTTLQTDRSNYITGARPYISGDRLSAIHWKATARTATLMTKEFEQEYSRDGTIMLLGMKGGVAYEWHLSLCQTILKASNQKNRKVDFLHIGHGRPFILTNKKQAELMDPFIAFKPGADEQKMDSAFTHYQQSVDKGDFLILFTDQLTSRLVEQVLDLSNQVNRISLYITKRQADQIKQEEVLETKLKKHRIQVYLLTEFDLKKRRVVVNI